MSTAASWLVLVHAFAPPLPQGGPHHPALPEASVALASATAPSRCGVFSCAMTRATVRRVEPREVSYLLYDVGVLCAEGIFSAATPQEERLLGSAIRTDLDRRFPSRGRAPTELLVAEDDESGEMVGCCAIEAASISESGEDVGGRVELVDMRPLLSGLAVSPAYRRRGIAKRLCAEAEAAAREWGYDEVLLKVDQTNARAIRLYRKLGYRKVGTDDDAERPEASSGRVRWLPVVNEVMRKDLRRPPADAVVKPLLLAALGGAAYANYPAYSQTPEYAALLQAGADAVRAATGA